MSEDDKNQHKDLVSQEEIDMLLTPSEDFSGVVDVPDEDNPAQSHFLLTTLALQLIQQKARGDEISIESLIDIANKSLATGNTILEQEARIQQQDKQIDSLNNIAYIDSVSGLYNRNGFNDQLKRELKLSTRQKDHNVGVFFLDLNNFKPINDTLGHDPGDAALKLVGEKITEALRETDVVARYGGDEFTIMITAPVEHDEHFETVRQKLYDLFIENKIIFQDPNSDREFPIGSAIGFARANEGIDIAAMGISIDKNDHFIYTDSTNNKHTLMTPDGKHLLSAKGIAIAGQDQDINDTSTSLIKRADFAMYLHKSTTKIEAQIQQSVENSWSKKLGGFVKSIIPSRTNPSSNNNDIGGPSDPQA